MAKISQMQFPPMRELEALARGESIGRHRVLVDYLPQLSVNWWQIRQLANLWNESIDKLLKRKLLHRDVRSQLELQRTKNIEEFMDSACRWIRENSDAYFPGLIRSVGILNRLAVPEPLVCFANILKTRSRPAGMRIRIKRWGNEKICIVEEAIPEGPKMNLLDPDELTTIRINVGKLWAALIDTALVDPKAKVFLRDPSWGYYSHYNEVWHQFPRVAADTFRQLHTGSAYTVILHDLVEPPTKHLIEKIEVFLESTQTFPRLAEILKSANREGMRLDS
jgi:hypothetical protein